MSNSQRGMSPAVCGLLVGLTIGVLAGWPFYPSVAIYFKNLHAMIPLWEPDASLITQHKLFKAILSAPTVAILWLLVCGWGGAAIGRRIERAA